MNTGRPSKLTPEVQEAIVKALECGCFRETAAASVDVDVSTFRRWMRRGKDETEGPYHAFRLAVSEAENRAEVNAIKRIIEAGKDDPKHLIWWLERKFPERWGRDSRRLRELEQVISELKKAILDRDLPSY